MRRPKSDFVREVLVDLPFTTENRKYVRDLLAIEDFVLHAPSSLGGGLLDERLRVRHPLAYRAIQKELRPSAYEAERRERAARAQADRAERRREAAAARRRDARDRALWRTLGGITVEGASARGARDRRTGGRAPGSS